MGKTGIIIGIIGLVLSFTAIVATVTVPEIRSLVGLEKSDTDPDSTNLPDQDDSKTFNIPTFVLNVKGVEKEHQAKTEVRKLRQSGYQADFLWIPDYESLSGVSLYCVFIGPFSNQKECEFATEKYRREVDPKAYGIWVGHENKRIEIRGIGKVKVIENYHP